METFNHHRLENLKSALNQRESDFLSPLAAFSDNAVRRQPDKRLETDYRQSFSVDVDRILNSLAYTRYIDKTQVFAMIRNDHITHRVLHVQLVSKISRTIGRFLGLNEDLIEAIALGHDIGHAPFGHDGERILSRLCRSHQIGYFHHNLQSIQFLDKVERKGRGWNLCLQTLDGILCHNGELHNQSLTPLWNKTFDQFHQECTAARFNPDNDLIPMTLEGCVVRMADTISYIGRDIEDALRLKLIERSDLPADSVKILGNTNGSIVYNLVTDVIAGSYRKPAVSFSPEVSEALSTLKTFNMERIYLNPRIKVHLGNIEELFEILFDKYLHDLEHENHASVIFTHFLENMSEDYINTHCYEETVRDFISGMTDRYFLRECPKNKTSERLLR